MSLQFEGHNCFFIRGLIELISHEHQLKCSYTSSLKEVILFVEEEDACQ